MDLVVNLKEDYTVVAWNFIHRVTYTNDMGHYSQMLGPSTPAAMPSNQSQAQ